MRTFLGTLVIVFALAQINCGTQTGQEEDASIPPTNPGDGIVSNEAFYVAIKDTDFTYYLHQYDNFEYKCEIAKNSTSQDIMCIMDVMEGDLWMNGYTFEYNVPQGMCTYFSFSNYFFYNRETGYGPETIEFVYEEILSGSTVIDTQLVGCAVDGGNTIPTCDSFDEVSLNSTAISSECVYDRSDQRSGKNCCLGDLTTKVSTYQGTTLTDYSENHSSWLGKFSNDCLGGPAITDSDWPKDQDGWPQTLYYDVDGTGINNSYTVESPISKYDGSFLHGYYWNIHGANFYSFDTNQHYHTGFTITSSTTLPYALAPVDDRNGTSMPSAQDSFEFVCYDQAFEVINRIKLYVREWNIYTEFILQSTGDPDKVGTEGTDCNYFSGPCDDRMDWDDFILHTQILSSSSYDTSSGQETGRRNFFPHLFEDSN